MHATQKRLSPTTIIKADDPSLGPKTRAEALWNKIPIRNATIASLGDSVELLADLWSSAWKTGNGNAIPKAKLVEFSEKDLEKIYRKEKGFVPSLSLAEMAQSGKFEPK
ncbi:MAG TPA: hypothetical protein VGO56_13450 [Pyrinomonadaceae bacterium]|jgi:hypothetical protein|nr:hypothetical protein [Pyrinomonadaceae bacterium]